MNLEWASIWDARVSIFQKICQENVRIQERDHLSAFAENKLRVGFSMGGKSIDFSYVLTLQFFEFHTDLMWWEFRKDNSYVWRFQERDRLSELAEDQLRVGLSMGSKSIDC
eukprot:1165617-Karenia_brevis.AAC.1